MRKGNAKACFGNLKNIAIFSFLILIVLVFIFSSFSGGVLAQVKNPIRIGCLKEGSLISVDRQNNYSGFGYDYMQKISSIAGWEPEFVLYDTHAEVENALQNDEVDLLFPLDFNARTVALYEFPVRGVPTPTIDGAFAPDYPMFSANVTLQIRSNEENIFYNDYARFSTMKIGYVADADIKYFEKFAIENNFYNENNLVKCNSYESMRSMLYSKVLDGILCSEIINFAKNKVVAKFEYAPRYIVANKNPDKSEVYQQLCSALEKLSNDSPNYSALLYDKYFKTNLGWGEAFTKAESDYLKGLTELKYVTYLHTRPISYIEKGKNLGISAEITKLVAQKLGVNLRFIETTSLVESYQMIANKQADFMNVFIADYNFAKKNNMRFTNAYLDAGYKRLTKKNSNSPTTVALLKGSYAEQEYSKNVIASNIQYYDSEQACADAVRRGECDSAVVSEYFSNLYLQKNYSTMEGKYLDDISSSLAFGVPSDGSDLLYSVLNKSIRAISATEINNIINQFVNTSYGNPRIKDIIYQEPILIVILISVVFVTVLGFMSYIIISRKKHQKHTLKLAYVDPLTGMWNSNYFEEQLKKRLRSRHDSGRVNAVVSVDISKFSKYNENYGRTFGDKIIKHVAEVLGEQKDILSAHMKADHFLFYTSQDSIELVKKMCEDINAQAKDFTDKKVSKKLTFHFGIFQVRSRNIDSASAIDFANLARKEAKKKNCIVVFDGILDSQIQKEMWVETNMEMALQTDDFKVYYQPKYNILDGKMSGAEALVRWQTGAVMMPPSDFIPVFEKNGFIVEMDFYVLEQVFKFLRRRIDEGLPVVRISVNQSGLHFSEEKYVDKLSALVKIYRIPKGLVELEITETVLIENDAFTKTLKRIKELGFEVSIDDFGAEYSSPYLLKEEFIDTVKLDRKFIENAGDSEKIRIIVTEIVRMSHELGLNVICEGIEKEDQIYFLKLIGCRYAQGYYFDRPMTVDDFKLRLAEKTLELPNRAEE